MSGFLELYGMVDNLRQNGHRTRQALLRGRWVDRSPSHYSCLTMTGCAPSAGFGHISGRFGVECLWGQIGFVVNSLVCSFGMRFIIGSRTRSTTGKDGKCATPKERQKKLNRRAQAAEESFAGEGWASR
eukprot:1137323-Amphidinium_carterae.1